ncbi:hypothetical protein V8C40DRAFT_147369 [Trichoderma camerunense]
MPVFTLGLGGYHGTSCNVSFSAQRNTVLIDPCASITDTDIPSKYRRIAVNRPSEHLCCLPIRTPPKCFPSPWPDTPLEILRGHLPVPIQTWSLLWVLLLWALAKDQRGPRLKRLNSYKGFLKSFHRRNFSSHSAAWLVRLSRQTLLDSRPGRRGLSSLCSAPCWAAVLWFGKLALVIPQRRRLRRLAYMRTMHIRNRVCISSYT